MQINQTKQLEYECLVFLTERYDELADTIPMPELRRFMRDATEATSSMVQAFEKEMRSLFNFVWRQRENQNADC